MKMAGFGFETPTFGRRLALMPGGVDATREPKLRGGMAGVLTKFKNILISGHPY